MVTVHADIYVFMHDHMGLDVVKLDRWASQKLNTGR